jgi:hypothetical protein
MKDQHPGIVHRRPAVPDGVLVWTRLRQHRARCGLGPVLVLKCECGVSEVLMCVHCRTAVLIVADETPCEHGRLLLEERGDAS